VSPRTRNTVKRAKLKRETVAGPTRLHKAPRSRPQTGRHNQGGRLGKKRGGGYLRQIATTRRLAATKGQRERKPGSPTEGGTGRGNHSTKGIIYHPDCGPFPKNLGSEKCLKKKGHVFKPSLQKEKNVYTQEKNCKERTEIPSPSCISGGRPAK